MSCATMRLVLFVWISAVIAASAWAQRASPDGAWTSLPAAPPVVLEGQAWVRPLAYHAAALDADRMRAVLAAAPMEDSGNPPLTIHLPMPDGTFARFAAFESPIMEPGLARAFPQIKTYAARGIDDPYATARLDLSPLGFHAQVLSPSGAVYIDPLTRDDAVHHASYLKRDLPNPGRQWRCHTVADRLRPRPLPLEGEEPVRAGPVRRIFRLAVAATGEYTRFFGGVAQAQAAIVTAVNRVNGIYETELSVRLVLVANNSAVVFPDPATDPYDNTNIIQMLDQNQTTLDSRIGPQNYDVGHVFSRAAMGGVAGLGTVCNPAFKAQGVSTFDPPVSDPFVVDYVAHEIGHQFNALHTFNACFGGVGGPEDRAMEPGSGSTIMAYAGICGPDDLQPNSDPVFHSRSFADINPFVRFSAPCVQNVDTGNTAPLVNAGPDIPVPAGTAFSLRASASDNEGDPITYSWEQFNGGPSRPVSAPDNGFSPLFRAFPPSADPSRTLPRYADILANQLTRGETYAARPRLMTMRVTARDGRGGINTDDAVVTIVGGPFRITAPATGDSWWGRRTVRWNVGGTNAPPFNASLVRILFSTDGGQTFPTVLAPDTPNDGAHEVTLPPTPTATGRIRIEPVSDAPWFDVTDTNIAIGAPPSDALLITEDAASFDDASGNGNGNGRLDAGERSVPISFAVRNVGLAPATGLVATLESLTPTAVVAVAQATLPVLQYGETSGPESPLRLSILPEHPCGTPVNLRITVRSSAAPLVLNASFVVGQPAGLGPPRTFSYTGPPVAIPDDDPKGVNVVLDIDGFQGPIGDADFRFDGAACSGSSGATGVGLAHPWVGDLIGKLLAPEPVEVTLFNRPGPPPFGSSGTNFCQTLLDDDTDAPSIQSIGAGGPFTGVYRPQQPLSAFDGRPANGRWLINIADVEGGFSGTLRAFSIILRPPTPPRCDPPRPFCRADVDENDVIDFNDLLAFLNLFNAGDPRADFSGDGVIDFNDVLAFLNEFSLPC